MNANILPCPFCGSKAVFQLDADHHGEFFELGCPDENCTGHWAYYTEEIANRDKAITAWNTRATAPAPASGWMDEKSQAHIARVAHDHKCAPWVVVAALDIGNLPFHGGEGSASHLDFVAIIARHAPDVAKLEAEVAECQKMWAHWQTEAAKFMQRALLLRWSRASSKL